MPMLFASTGVLGIGENLHVLSGSLGVQSGGSLAVAQNLNVSGGSLDVTGSLTAAGLNATAGAVNFQSGAAVNVTDVEITGAAVNASAAPVAVAGSLKFGFFFGTSAVLSQ